jgi:hypothetical protein
VSSEPNALRWFAMEALDSVLPALGADASLRRLGRKVRAILALGAGKRSAQRAEGQRRPECRLVAGTRPARARAAR